MAKKHRSRAWAEAPQVLNSPIIDNHTHMASVVSYSMDMAAQAAERNLPEVPVYSVEELIRKAHSVGVNHMIDVACELPTLHQAINMAKQYPQSVKAAIAIHPNETVLHGHGGAQGPDGLEIQYKPWHDIPLDEALNAVYTAAHENPDDVVAIGETGLDYFRTGEGARQSQREAFRKHIELAKDLGLAMQIHDRDAHEDVIEILLRDGAPERTIFHSYSADEHIAHIARERGWYLSFSGTVTYKSNERLRQALRVIDPQHILIETDAPYLTPEPYRGRTNASYLTPYTLQVMAEVLEMPTEQMTEITYDNTVTAYDLPYKR
ncbi:TatD family deoxyribonuclease [Alloscardovia theropitheci]|uniref:TatD family deoxyribonuclease n=1 Tax=Alloscardovia theropitheci TaxID=2496842 RepID=A0A4R0QPQ3_9BIFI|nr:TatD family hydrolase [Alloscardovia theropitheci]TCD54224.1 TatD family deoxyribonuclease [Alloscardovia theropitheci]